MKTNYRYIVPIIGTFVILFALPTLLVSTDNNLIFPLSAIVIGFFTVLFGEKYASEFDAYSDYDDYGNKISTEEDNQ